MASYWYFDSYTELVAKHRGSGSPISGLSISTLGMSLLSLPCILIIARIWPKISIFREIHAACYLSFLLLISYASGSPGHSSPGAAFGKLIEFVLYSTLIIELVIIAYSNLRRGYFTQRAIIFMAIVAALLGGWFVGVYLWSIQMPSKVLSAAEAEAGENPYCIEAAGKLAHNRSDLNALNMYVRDYSGFISVFHGLLVIQEESGRKYMNWSYHDNKFHLISDRFLENKSYDKSTCMPVKDFGKKLL